MQRVSTLVGLIEEGSYMSSVEELTKLATLKEKGILTEAEFNLEKQKILSASKDKTANGSTVQPKTAEPGKVKRCKSCQVDIAKKASKCPHCQTKQGAGTFGKLCLVIGVVWASIHGFIGYQGGAHTDAPTKVLATDQVALTDKFEIRVRRIEVRQRVGSEFFGTVAGKGANYLAVIIEVKNVSDRPVSWLPDVAGVIDGKGIKYNRDHGASGAYATEVNFNTKILSDLNPGVTTEQLSVFELPVSLTQSKNWVVVIDAGERIHFVDPSNSLVSVGPSTVNTAAISKAQVQSEPSKSLRTETQDSSSTSKQDAATTRGNAARQEGSKLQFLTSIPRVYLPALQSIYSAEINDLTAIDGTIDWAKNSPIALAPIYLRQGTTSGVEDLLVHFQSSAYCGSDGCMVGVVLWDDEADKYTVVNQLWATELAFGVGYTNGMHDLRIDGLSFEWDGKKYVTASASAEATVETE
jgi:hypothetical protein